MAPFPLDTILLGNSIELLDNLPEKSVDLIFADPPYNLQLRGELWRPNLTRVNAVDDSWDQFASFKEYDDFTHQWLVACRRVLKDDGAIWVIGTYHNIYRIGRVLQDIGYWILNDLVWIKNNPMPNFRGTRFTNAHETLIWASKTPTAKYTFHYQVMKSLNDDLQMRSDWYLPICTGPERLKENCQKAHSTQKPESILYRILLATTNPGDIILDPFFGTGTTGAVPKKLGRHWIGIEQREEYVQLAQRRIDDIIPLPMSEITLDFQNAKHQNKRIPFGTLLESGMLSPGQKIFFGKERKLAAVIRADGRLILDGATGSIHTLARKLLGGKPCNGWDYWYVEIDSDLKSIDTLRQEIRNKFK